MWLSDFAFTHDQGNFLTTCFLGLWDLSTREQSITYAILLCVSCAILATALLVAAHWFRTNVSRLSGRIAFYARQLAFSSTLQDIRTRHPQIWEFLARRFEPEEYLGLHLTIGLTISVAALWLFSALAEDIRHLTPLTQFDVTTLEWFQSNNTQVGMQIFEAISFLGSPLILSILGTALAIYLVSRHAWIFLASWIAGLVGAGILSWLLKTAIHRPRPVYAIAVLPGHSFSFPSGHALASLVAYGMAAYFVIVLSIKEHSSRTTVVCLASILIFAIGVSRLYLGVHYFTDVVAGYAAGAVWLSACITGAAIARRQPAAQSAERRA